jgi:iron complex transport system ATP-binding protein
VKLRVNGIEFGYRSSPILKGIDMELDRSEVLAVVGPNGAGKSTLIKCIDRILEPKKGSILIDSIEVRHLPRNDLAKRMGYVPQSGTHAFPATVFDVVMMGRRPHSGWIDSDRDMEIVHETLCTLGLDGIALYDFNELSGGQKQKVIIARALVQEPEVLLMDEPTASLDIRHQLEVMSLMRRIVSAKGISAIVAVHDLNLATKYADRVVMMKGGAIVAAGKPAEIFTEESIREVYGVRAVVKREDNVTYIIAVEPV